MSCSPFDLRDYFLKELSDAQERLMEGHVRICQPCREEMDRLRLTEATLFGLRDEEIPQRIAFISDKIFEPSPWRRWLAAFWSSGARLGFASAALLSAAILVFAFTRPAPAPVAPNAANVTAASGLSTADMDRRIQTAVTRAVTESEVRQAKTTEQMISEVKRRDREELERFFMTAAKDNEYLQRKLQMERTSYSTTRDPGDGQ